MPAIAVQDLIDDSNCLVCEGIDLAQALILTSLANILVTINPAMMPSVAQLVTDSECFVCFGIPLGRAMELALLDRINTALAA